MEMCKDLLLGVQALCNYKGVKVKLAELLFSFLALALWIWRLQCCVFPPLPKGTCIEGLAALLIEVQVTTIIRPLQRLRVYVLPRGTVHDVFHGRPILGMRG